MKLRALEFIDMITNIFKLQFSKKIYDYEGLALNDLYLIEFLNA